ncbi:Spy/CpxP family protein refolding chaperone [bacterium]|nr:Spy/CpxP family protein refolding chaperone [bacterium]
MKRTLILTALLLMTASTVLAADNTIADNSQKSQKNCVPCNGKMMPPPPMKGHGNFQKNKPNFENRLNLTEAQKTKLKKNHEDSKQKMEPLINQLRQKEEAKREIIKKYEEKDADLIKLNKEIKDLRAKCDVIRDENRKYFESILTKEQKAELEKMKQERKDFESNIKKQKK